MVDAVGFRNYGVYNTPDTTEVKNPQNKQDNTAATSTKVNFEGRRDFDSFEKKDHTARNVTIGTGIAALALYVAAAIAGKRGVTFKGDNWFAKKGNTCLEYATKSVNWLKEKVWDRVANLFKKDTPKAE